MGRMEVARLAGVSPAVVSYVTNGSHPVSDATRARVRAAIDQLGYRPNAVARSLAIARTHSLGLLLPDSSNPYFAELSSAIEDAAFDAGFTVLLGNGSNEARREQSYARTFLDRQVDGVIVCPGNDVSHVLDELRGTRTPVVVTDRLGRTASNPAVVVDHAAGAALATRHLVEHGRRVHACISGNANVSAAQARAEGWRDALAAGGVPVDERLLTFVDFTAEAGYTAMLALLDREPGIDAVFVASDLQAVGVLRALRDRGRSAGHDVSVIGFDGIRLSGYTSPRLTTVAQPFRRMATALIDRLVGLIESAAGDRHSGDRHHDDQTDVLATSLILRESCGCRPTASR